MKALVQIIFSFLLLNLLILNDLRAESFEVVTWNIQKANQKKWWTYIDQSPDVHFWAIQEATSQNEILQQFQNNFFTDYNPAWSNAKQSTGTLSASKVKPTQVLKVVTDVTEPLVLTPKSFIVSDVDYNCGREVRILNVHMINFLLGSGYKKQLEQMAETIDNFQGPLIVLGDFNNWNWFRTQTLLNWADEHGLSLAYKENFEIKGIDHIFYKNLKLVRMQTPQVYLSDHEPIHGVFECQVN